jgi:hypothetical protein
VAVGELTRQLVLLVAKRNGPGERARLGRLPSALARERIRNASKCENAPDYAKYALPVWVAPVLGPSKILETSFGSRSAKLIIQDHVLRLTYTAHDLAPFARDMGYINKDGSAKPPII